MPQIGERTISEAKSLLGALLDDYKDDIDQAYRQKEGSLKIDMTVTFKPDGSGTDIKTTIAFDRMEKIKDSAHGKIDDKQQEMFDKE